MVHDLVERYSPCSSSWTYAACSEGALPRSYNVFTAFLPLNDLPSLLCAPSLHMKPLHKDSMQTAEIAAESLSMLQLTYASSVVFLVISGVGSISDPVEVQYGRLRVVA